MAFERKIAWRGRAALSFVAFALPWMIEAGCVPKGACLRNTDCPKGQACVEGACAYESVTIIVGDAAAVTTPPGTGGAVGTGGSTGTGGVDSGSSEPPSETDSGSSVSVDAGDVTPLTDH